MRDLIDVFPIAVAHEDDVGKRSLVDAEFEASEVREVRDLLVGVFGAYDERKRRVEIRLAHHELTERHPASPVFGLGAIEPGQPSGLGPRLFEIRPI